jgi:hypothetical protein
MLKIRKSSALFRLRSGADVMQRLKFYNVGPTQIPGLIVATLSDPTGHVDRKYKSIAVLINADKVAHSLPYLHTWAAASNCIRFNKHPAPTCWSSHPASIAAAEPRCVSAHHCGVRGKPLA